MKLQRHNAIKDLLVTTAVTNQDELRRKLEGRGITVTQATLSRDIREMKLMKGPAGYALPSSAADDDDGMPELSSIMASFAIEVRQAQNLLVLITIMGGAQPVAAAIDSEEWDDVMGTIAGENTVLLVCPDNAQAAVVRARLEAHIV